MEWADFLEKEKCGGPRPTEEPDVRLGDRYMLYWLDEEEPDHWETVTEDNINWFRWALTSPDNDCWTLKKV